MQIQTKQKKKKHFKIKQEENSSIFIGRAKVHYNK